MKIECRKKLILNTDDELRVDLEYINNKLAQIKKYY